MFCTKSLQSLQSFAGSQVLSGLLQVLQGKRSLSQGESELTKLVA